MKIQSFLVLILGVMALGSCSSTDIAESRDVNQDQIHMEYSADYDGEDQELRVHGQFRFGGNSGTTLKLTEPSAFLYNGIAPKGYDEIWGGWKYAETMQNYGYTGKNEFVFIDTDGVKIMNDIPLVLNEISIDKPVAKSDLRVEIHGIVEDGVSQTVYFGSDSTRFTFSVDGNMAIIPVQYYDSLKMDNGYVQYSKSLSKALTNAKALGGDISVKILSKKVKFVVPKDIW